MIIFEESNVNIGVVGMPTLFYHCDVVATGASEARYVSCDVSLTVASFLTHLGYYFYHSKVTLSDNTKLYHFQDIMIPMDFLIRNELSAVAKKVMIAGVTYPTEPEDSGNAYMWDQRYEFMQDLFIPFSSLNGENWAVGFDMSEDKSYDFLFNQESFPDRRLRDIYTFGVGTHVGKYSPATTTLSLDPNNNLTAYVLGLLPEDMFIQEEVLKMMGILDGYEMAGLTPIWDRNDKELRYFLRSMAVTLGRSTGSVVQMHLAMLHLWKNKNNFIPAGYQVDLNKDATFRVGASWFNIVSGAPLTISPDVTSGINATPHYWIDSYQRFRLGRVDVTPGPENIVAGDAVLIYLDLEDAIENYMKVDFVTSDFKVISEYVATQQRYHPDRFPVMAFTTDGALGAVKEIMFYRDAVVGSSITAVTKYNALIRTYATKSRGCNIFTNFYNTNEYVDYKILLNEIYNKAYAPDTRLFAWHDDSGTGMPIVEELH